MKESGKLKTFLLFLCFSRIRKQVIIVWDKRASTCSMIEKISPKGVSFSDFVCIFALSVEDLFDFYRNIKLGESSGMAKFEMD